MSDLISRQAAIDALCDEYCGGWQDCKHYPKCENLKAIQNLPSAQSTLYGYNTEHLEMIARVLQKEDLPPEKIVEVLTDIGRIVAIVRDEFEEALRKAVEQCIT